MDSLVLMDTLRGAVVAVEGREGSVLTDAHGGFALDSVARGARRLLVRHPVLDSLGVGAIPIPVLVDDGDLGLVWLPSMEAYHAMLCRPVRGRVGDGALLGTVRRASDDAPLADVEVVGAWRSADSTFAGSGNRPRVRTRSDSAGHFVLCNVPRFSPVELWASDAGNEVGRIRVQLGARLMAGYDISLERGGALPAGPSAAPAPGVVRGRVLTATGDGLPNVAVTFDRPARRVTTDREGRFLMPDVPPGVRTLEVRAIGFQPQRIGLNVRPGESVERDFTVDRNLVVLGTVLVRADRAVTWDSAGFEERRRRGNGYFFTRDALSGITDLATALRLVPGIRGRSNDRVQRLVAGRGAGCYPSFVVNRVRFEPGGSIGPEAMIRAEDIRAMEVYTSRLSTPPEHQRYGDCAVIVIWLRDPQREIEARRERR
jgi:hypothetical protein